MADVITIGEAMLRLCPGFDLRLEQAQKFDLEIGGAELNVAVALSRLGTSSAFMMKLPDNPLGHLLVNRARSWGVDVSRMVWSPEGRVGTYFIEYGKTPRSINVVYDRKDSAINTLLADELDWDFIGGGKLLHTTGITMGVGDNCKQLVMDVIARARKLGLLVSFDVNFRSRLWTPEQARKAIDELVGQIDILFVTKDDASIVLGLEGEPSDVVSKLHQKFACKLAVMTLGAEGAIVCDDDGVTGQSSYDLEVVDRVGGGDAFAAGFIYGHLNGSTVMAMEYAAAMAALKYSIIGDFAIVTKKELEQVIAGGTRGVQR